MEDRGLSLADVREIPRESLVLLTGPPGAGKSGFCDQVVLNGIATEQPVIFVTTEQRPGQVLARLTERGLGETAPEIMSFVDAYSDTVGVESPERADTIRANCLDLNSISIAATRLQERTGRKGVLLALDSLTSPYLLAGAEVIRFARLFLSRFAGEGNSVLALMDEGCGNEQDLVALMSVADGVIKIETEEGKQLFNVVKHPKVRPTRIEAPVPPSVGLREFNFDPRATREFLEAEMRRDEAWMRREVGDFVNLFWPNLAHWSGMLWDPKGFPKMIYEMNKQEPCRMITAGWAHFPRRMRVVSRLFVPKNFGRVKDMKRVYRFLRGGEDPFERSWIGEYLEDVSKTDEHYFRLHESYECWGFENIGATVASHFGPEMAGGLMAFEGLRGLERDWNAIETKCIGLGDPYCEFKFVPGEIDGLKDSLEKDVSVIERIHERLMDRLTGFLLYGKPLVQRPRLGSDIHIHPVMHAFGFPHVAGERYQMALRMGGARSGKEIGEHLTNAGLGENEAIRRVIDFIEYCKVGRVTVGETIRIEDNCESLRDKLHMTIGEPSCFFTTGFLNGLFSAVKNQHVKEVKCIAAGHPYCEWEIL
jgi:predicted hydrocarbon binding protein/KaiC/GvpD/RAD55 family RecA-like ATPase